MVANEPNRSDYRNFLAQGLEAKIVTGLGHAQACYAYQISDFAGQSPVLVVTSRNSKRDQQTFGANNLTTFGLDVHIFTLYSADGWTESEAETRADLLEKEVTDWVVDNRSGTIYWNVSGETQLGGIELGGDEYKHEVVPITALIP